ncbi:MAG: hypothetical protein J1F32_03265 [Erysipelotrichales bacterium]|nr:hypothetical protein [Erysipelotrichales bacterium]
MKKRLCFSLLLVLGLTSCGNGGSENTLPNSGEQPTPTIEAPTTLLGLQSLLNVDGVSHKLEAKETKSSLRHTEEVKFGMWAISTKVSDEELTTHEGPYVYIVGASDTTYEMTDEWVPQYEDEHEEYETFRGMYQNKFYTIVDYAGGKENDFAEVNEVVEDVTNPETQISKDSIDFMTTTTACDFVLYYLDMISGMMTDLNPKVEADKSFSYSFSFSGQQSDEYGVYPYDINFEVSFESDGFLKGYKLSYEQRYQIDLETEDIDYSIKDEVTITRGSRAATHSTLPIVPTDYWLQDYEVQLVAAELDTYLPVDSDEIPVDYYVDARMKSTTPEKALDTKVEIIASSDNSVIEVSPYGVVRARQGGTTTLTVRSESGLEKTIDATVVVPDTISMVIKAYSSTYYKGQSYNIYVFFTPDNVREELEWEVSDTSVLNLVFDKYGDPSIECLEAGTSTITATSKKNPNITSSLTITVTEKLNLDELKLAVIGHWNNVSNNGQWVEFKEDKTGTFYYDEPYEFTWEVDESSINRDELRIRISPITGYNGNNMAYLTLDGLSLKLELLNEDYWYFMYQGTFTK